jgi:tRNA(fMet)-specific endonuclease VapC
VKFLLDTNACIALINDKTPFVRNRLQKALAAEARAMVSSVAAFELWYGAAKSARSESNARLVDAFLSGPVTLLAFDSEDAKVAGRLRAELEAVGKPIGSYDLLIAAQALRHQLTLITANAREFGRVKGLRWEDWDKS